MSPRLLSVTDGELRELGKRTWIEYRPADATCEAPHSTCVSPHQRPNFEFPFELGTLLGPALLGVKLLAKKAQWRQGEIFLPKVGN